MTVCTPEQMNECETIQVSVSYQCSASHQSFDSSHSHSCTTHSFQSNPLVITRMTDTHHPFDTGRITRICTIFVFRFASIAQMVHTHSFKSYTMHSRSLASPLSIPSLFSLASAAVENLFSDTFEFSATLAQFTLHTYAKNFPLPLCFLIFFACVRVLFSVQSIFCFFFQG